MRTFHESVVAADEIDGLGHLNVRYYIARALRANAVLMDGLGLDPASLGARLVQADTYTRYHREQFEGSTLQVRGGVLEAHGDRIRVYFEVCNGANAEVAATFILPFVLADQATRAPIRIPEPVLAEAADALVTLPEHGGPRTIDLGPPRIDLSYAELESRLGEGEATDPMSWRMERTIEPESCDAFGFLSDSEDFMFGQVRNIGPADEKNWGPMTFTTEEGHRVGWASLETRNVRVSQPRAGDVICSIGAEIGLHAKVRHSRRWIFNRTTGQLVQLNDNIALALDLDARRSIEIPSKLRSQLEKRHLPEFA